MSSSGTESDSSASSDVDFEDYGEFGYQLEPEYTVYFSHNILRFAHQKWLAKKGKEINIFKSLARSDLDNVFSTKSKWIIKQRN
jgi:hypothetical protein